MAKYSYELKKKIVEEYLSGKTSYSVLEDKYQIDESLIKNWVNNYKHFGDEGLMRSRNNRAYSVEFKLEAITRYETSECSYQQLALELGLTNPSMIVNWRRKYREEGIEGLRPHKRGRPVTKKDDSNQTPKSSTNDEPLDASTREALENRIKELEAENRKLTIQKMYLEQLRSLAREEAMKKRRRSSLNSENNSN
ncbi:helix-turn-helix domain-containing protein [Aedoeadaptatus coli]|uniref:helix-turn-helix domain-containing protein n=1 Tax=Aedoeadaptatus coli TaxID=2058292 RepID=UPI001F1D6121|nr:helix-turn-helix domain-containing protein [Peptoniphilus coli]